MSVLIDTKPGEPVQTVERTYLLTVENRLGEVPRVTAKRERVEMRGAEVQRWLNSDIAVHRQVPDVATETIALAGHEGVQVSVLQLWETIAALLDRWAAETPQGGSPP